MAAWWLCSGRVDHHSRSRQSTPSMLVSAAQVSVWLSASESTATVSVAPAARATLRESRRHAYVTASSLQAASRGRSSVLSRTSCNTQWCRDQSDVWQASARCTGSTSNIAAGSGPPTCPSFHHEVGQITVACLHNPGYHRPSHGPAATRHVPAKCQQLAHRLPLWRSWCPGSGCTGLAAPAW